MLKYTILKRLYKLRGMNPAKMEMVQYWKTQDVLEAKVVTGEDGSLVMVMGEGKNREKYPHPGFPRGHLLLSSDGNYTKLSTLKHQIKCQLFNDSWRRLDEGRSEESVIQSLHEAMDRIIALGEDTKYDRVPPTKFAQPVKEIWRAWTKVAPSTRSKALAELFCFIIQEDDSYRFRVQDFAEYFDPNRWERRLLRWFKRMSYDEYCEWQVEWALKNLEHAEIIGDMKERQRLWRRVVLLILQDPKVKATFVAFCREVDWKKVYLRKGDKYHYRGKYVKVDRRLFDY